MNINDLVITGVSTDEQETTINYGRNDEEAEVYTSDNTVLTKIKNMFSSDDCEWKLKDVVKDQKGNLGAVNAAGEGNGDLARAAGHFVKIAAEKVGEAAAEYGQRKAGNVLVGAQGYC